MFSDLSTFVELPNGQLNINVLDGSCDHSETGRIETYIAGEIRAWFLNRLDKHNIPVDNIQAASLTVAMKNTIPTTHKTGVSFDWTCDAAISTVDRHYSAHLAETHTWIPTAKKHANGRDFPEAIFRPDVGD